MTNGVLFYAFNNDAFDYISIANLNALLVKKHMKVPTAIITDEPDKCSDIFYEVITVKKPDKSKRSFIDSNNEVMAVDWYNRGRFSAIHLSPFNKTFVLDSDYLIFNNNLNSMYNTDIPFSCSSQVITMQGQRKTEKMSFNTLDMEWATVLYFDRSSMAIKIMKRAESIITNYKYYSLQCGFLSGPYRNDYALTIALNASHGANNPSSRLPPLFTIYSQEKILRVNKNGSIVIQIANGNTVRLHNTNVHIMNKTAIMDHYKELEAYANL